MRCSSPSLTGDLSLVRYGVPCMQCFRVLLGRTFTFGLRTEIEKLKRFVKNLGFLSSPGEAVTGACRPQLLHKETVLACHSVRRRRMTFT